MMRQRAVLLALGAGLLSAGPAAADEGGVSFWLPGQYGSLAATPAEPGWSLPVVYYHASSDAGGEAAFPIGGRITAGVEARGDLAFLSPTYVFGTPVAGGQASIGFTAMLGNMAVEVEGTLTGPGGNQVSAHERDTVSGIGDLFPTASLRWAQGNHNTMVYSMVGVPVGEYERGRLANLGTNHWSFDAGGGYTYLDAAKGHEISAVLGFTHNGENHDTDYRNGASAHLDWAASQFLSETMHVGIAGYWYHQLGGDSGDGAVLGDFKSRVAGIGPQLGYLFALNGRTGYLNFKGYHEFGAENRPSGWNAFATLVVPLGGAAPH